MFLHYIIPSLYKLVYYMVYTDQDCCILGIATYGPIIVILWIISTNVYWGIYHSWAHVIVLNLRHSYRMNIPLATY